MEMCTLHVDYRYCHILDLCMLGHSEGLPLGRVRRILFFRLLLLSWNQILPPTVDHQNCQPGAQPSCVFTPCTQNLSPLVKRSMKAKCDIVNVALTNLMEDARNLQPSCYTSKSA